MRDMIEIVYVFREAPYTFGSSWRNDDHFQKESNVFRNASENVRSYAILAR